VTRCGTGFTWSILVYNGMNKKNAKYSAVQIFDSKG
jgi:hypothetical protein